MKSISLTILNLSAVAVLASAGADAFGQDWADETYGGKADRGIFNGSGSSFTYEYLDLGVFNYEFDQEGIEAATGFGAEFSLPVVSIFYVTAGLSYGETDTSLAESLDYISWNAGVGFGLPIKSNLDFTLEGGLARQKFVTDLLDDPIDGYGTYVTPGIRLMLGDLLELNGGVAITNIDSNTELGVDLKALLHLTPRLSAFGSANFSDEVSQYGLGLRLSF